MTRRGFVVRGVVQGVNFRTAAADEARRLGITGRIWNRADGAVECVVEGDAASIDSFRAWLGRGPRSARVERVEARELDGDRRYSEFAIARAPAD